MEAGLFYDLEMMLKGVARDLDEARSPGEKFFGRCHRVTSVFHSRGKPRIDLSYNTKEGLCFVKQYLGEPIYGVKRRILATITERDKGGLIAALNPNLKGKAQTVDIRLNAFALIKNVGYESFYGCFGWGDERPLEGQETHVPLR